VGDTYNKFGHSVSHDIAEENDRRDDQVYGADDVGEQLCCDVVWYTVEPFRVQTNAHHGGDLPGKQNDRLQCL
jgi:hypothetical protein